METRGNRTNIGVRTGMFGIICNICLSISKFVVGLLSGSIAVLADAANNLFDAASSLASLLGFRMASKSADKEHPYGHGRVEYFAGLFISILIIITAIEFMQSSVLKIITPSKPEFSYVYVLVLAVSVAVKLFMGFYYRSVSRKIDSPTIMAQATDSFSDAALTLVILISLFLSNSMDAPIDGVAGLLASVVVMFGGIFMTREISTPLLGAPPSDELVRAINSSVMAEEHILGLHDLIIHEYGPERIMASIHTEMPSSLSFSESHEIITRAERCIYEDYGISLVIHADPVDLDSEQREHVCYHLKTILQDIDPALAYHDLRLEADNGHTDVVFDLVIPYSMGENIQAIRDRVLEGLKSINKDYDPIISCDRV